MPPCVQRKKSKIHKTKKLQSNSKELTSKNQTKYLRNTKLRRHHRHSRFKHRDIVSNYVGPERLTNHVGFFTKGKISDSISRIEKLMPEEIKARARQDLREVLKLTSRNKHPKHYSYFTSASSSKEQSVRNSFYSPPSVPPRSGFSSNLWKDKLQKSIGVTTVNSVLASVSHPKKKSPVENIQHIARQVLLTKIHSSIKKANKLLFPSVSNSDKLKRKLKQMMNDLKPTSEISTNKAVFEDFQKSTAVNFQRTSSRHSQNNSMVNSQKTLPSSSECSSASSNSVEILPEEEFHLNPIYTGEIVNQTGFSKIFPNISDFLSREDNLARNLPNDLHRDYERASCSRQSTSISCESVATFVPVSPTTSNDSPAVKMHLSPVIKLQFSPAIKLPLSPAKFVPDVIISPKLYYRHKMF